MDRTKQISGSKYLHVEEIFLDIHGIRQRLVITTRDTDAPVLLFLHGHGTPTSLFAHEICEDEDSRLCERFVLVHWDQRGAGASYTRDIPPESMNQAQFVADAHEAAQYLKNRFGQEKIYLVAQSWGSIIGLRLLQKYPGDFVAYLGEGQTADYAGALRNMQNYARQEAARRNHKKALRQLYSVSFPQKGADIREILKFNRIVSKWANQFILEDYGGKDLVRLFKSSMRKSPFYKKPGLKIKLLQGMQFTRKHTLRELFETNLSGEINHLEVPVCFIMGRYDFIMPGTRKFFGQLDAQQKEWLLFENSGHAPSLDEAERFEAGLMKMFGMN